MGKRKIINNLFYLFGITGCLVALLCINNTKFFENFVSPFNNTLSPLTKDKKNYEVFGFAPYWNFKKLENINYSVLTTFAYFGIPIDENGNLIKDDPGYQTYWGDRATETFKKSHAYGTRVVLTITMMDNDTITAFLDDKKAQERAIKQSVAAVEKRGIDGVNVDFEYVGNPGKEYKNKFSTFVEKLSSQMHQKNPISKVTVSVYASSARYPKMYDVKKLSDASDGIFMMAYDFATTGSEIAIPTAPLNGFREGKYWYDISTAVDDFLTQMPAKKLILGVPYYGYNYVVSKPGIKAETMSYYSEAVAQTYSTIKNEINPTMDAASQYKTGWDTLGKVSWKAYYDEEIGTWRMVFFEDDRSLSLKYDFAKNKNLKGVGIWALGMDEGKEELWDLLTLKFGNRIADQRSSLN